MTHDARSTTVTSTHADLARHGLVRLEVTVPAADAILLRHVAAALADPAQAAQTRVALHERFGAPALVSRKRVIEVAPLDDIDLDRPRDGGRVVDL